MCARHALADLSLQQVLLQKRLGPVSPPVKSLRRIISLSTTQNRLSTTPQGVFICLYLPVAMDTYSMCMRQHWFSDETVVVHFHPGAKRSYIRSFHWNWLVPLTQDRQWWSWLALNAPPGKENTRFQIIWRYVLFIYSIYLKDDIHLHLPFLCALLVWG